MATISETFQALRAHVDSDIGGLVAEYSDQIGLIATEASSFSLYIGAKIEGSKARKFPIPPPPSPPLSPPEDFSGVHCWLKYLFH